MAQTSDPTLQPPGFIRRLSSRSNLSRCLFVFACLATLVAIFYAEENWRGTRAWEKSRRELEARGEVLDWAAYIPAPVQDDQNIFKAPKMTEWFVRENFTIDGPRSTNATGPFVLPQLKVTDLVLAEMKMATLDDPIDSQATDVVLRLDDPAAKEQAAKLLRESLGPCAVGARNCVLVARPLEQIKPLHLVLQAETTPTAKELAAFFVGNPLTNSALNHPDVSYFRAEPVSSSACRLVLKGPVYGAADYLKWTEPQTSAFDLIRSALKRPCARMDGSYERPFGIPIPNFVQIRNVAQTLAERAQSCLLLDQPDAAWHELALVRDLCRLLLAEPNGKPITLVGAMINVAVTGLYAGIVQDGLRLHAWREPQLLALERQLKDTDLLGPVVEAFKEERAATCRTFEITPRRELVKLFNFDRLLPRLAVTCMPRGWFYQNMAVGTEFVKEWLDSVDLTNRLIQARRISESLRSASLEFGHPSPCSFLVQLALPNFAKALQTTALNQTLVNQALLACALERYRLAQGKYPDTIDALAPQFIDKPPHDLIGGQPLKYRRTADNQFLLYSIGWNEKDDDGIPARSREQGDWVWRQE